MTAADCQSLRCYFSVSLTPQGRGGKSYVLTRTGPPQVNLVLLHFLQTQFGINIPQEDLVALLNGGDESEELDRSLCTAN